MARRFSGKIRRGKSKGNSCVIRGVKVGSAVECATWKARASSQCMLREN